jgi:hypothetical protein
LDDDDEVLENKNSCTMAGGEPTYLVMRGGNPGCKYCGYREIRLHKKILNL